MFGEKLEVRREEGLVDEREEGSEVWDELSRLPDPLHEYRTSLSPSLHHLPPPPLPSTPLHLSSPSLHSPPPALPLHLSTPLLHSAPRLGQRQLAVNYSSETPPPLLSSIPPPPFSLPLHLSSLPPHLSSPLVYTNEPNCWRLRNGLNPSLPSSSTAFSTFPTSLSMHTSFSTSLSMPTSSIPSSFASLQLALSRAQAIEEARALREVMCEAMVKEVGEEAAPTTTLDTATPALVPRRASSTSFPFSPTLPPASSDFATMMIQSAGCCTSSLTGPQSPPVSPHKPPRPHDLRPPCGFCRENEPRNPEVFMAHALRRASGAVNCPLLRSFTCPTCGATGDAAHTRSYCPLNPGKSVTSALKSTNRLSDGRLRKREGGQ